MLRDSSGTRCHLRRFRRPGGLDSIGSRAWFAGPIVVVALALAAAGWLAVRNTPPVVSWLDVGSPGDAAHITGAFSPERNQTETYRWTTSSAVVTVPAPVGARYRIDLAIASIGDQQRTLTLTCPAGETTAQLATGQTPPVVTIECDSDGEIPIQISVPEIRVDGDGRPLGVALRDVRVTSLDSNLTAVWRLRAGLVAAAAIVGLWLAVGALAGTRIASAATATSALVAVAISTRHPEWTLSMIAGPGGLVALSAGYAAWLLQQGRRTGPLVLGIVSIVAWLLVWPPNPSILLPALWTPHDHAGYVLLPWLAALAIIAAALVDGPRATTMAAAGA
ncbi:MAG TPA: hypothetical protein VFV93_18930, partial [Thermomicrobiales bacterium]|nr:hypothetical protein [Thermomicrobiales bacterium]